MLWRPGAIGRCETQRFTGEGGLDYTDLFYFTAVAEAKGFSAAERRLGVSKATLSRRLAALEERLGVRLLNRSSRHLALTGAGAMLYDHCKGIGRDIACAMDSVCRLKGEPAGLVRMSCRPIIAQYYMARVLAGFMAEYPDIRVELIVTDDAIHPVEAGMDVCVTTLPLEDLPTDIIVKKLAEDTFVPVASPGYVDRCGEPLTPEDVPGFKTIGCGAGIQGREQKWTFVSGSGSVRAVRHSPQFICSDLRVQYHAAIQSAGIALLPAGFLRDALDNRWLRRLLPDWTAHAVAVNALFPSGKEMLSSVRMMLEYIGENLPAAMGLSRSAPGGCRGFPRS